MNNTLDVIFLGSDDARHARLVESLSHLGFNVRRCPDLVDVYDRFSRRPSPLVVLEAPLPDVHNAAVRLRAIDRSLGIVAIAPFLDAESRIRTLLCGADACLPPDVTGLELAAVLQALVSSGETAYLALAVFAVMMSLIGAFYYLRVVKVMYFDNPITATTVSAPLDVRAVLSINGALVLILGILPGGLMALCARSIVQMLKT